MSLIRLNRPIPLTDEEKVRLMEAAAGEGTRFLRGRPSLEAIYEEAVKEAGGVASFAVLMGTEMYRRLIDSFNRPADSNWRAICDIMNLKDFREHKICWISAAQDFESLRAVEEYPDSTLYDFDAGLALDTFGRKFTVTRETIINDDLNAFQKWPERMAQAWKRKLSKMVFQGVLLANVNAFDGGALFNNARTAQGGHTVDNLDTSTALAENALDLAIQKFMLFRDHATGEYLNILPRYLVVSPDIFLTAKRILSSTERTGTTSAGAAYFTGTDNPARPYNLELVCDPHLMLTSAGAAKAGHWMLFPDPAEVPVVHMGFLNGQQEPDLLVRVEAQNLQGGGSEPYKIDFDEIEYKARGDAAAGVSSYYAYAATSESSW
jgi:hypothetical protein